MANPFVSLLAQYAPSYSNDAKYDETIQSTLKNLGIDPDSAISIKTDVLSRLEGNFVNQDISSIKHVILTGTAGDGKTYHSREIASRIKGKIFQWKNDPVVDIQSNIEGCSYTLRIIKDLTELDENEKSKYIEHFLSRLSGSKTEEHPIFYLICANDGKLMASLKAFQGQYSKVYAMIERMLIENLEDLGENEIQIPLKMYNLSRTENRNNFTQIVEQITEHKLWKKCENCDILKECPIQVNRKRLLTKEGVERSRKRFEQNGSELYDLSTMPEYAHGIFFDRLADILELVSYNNIHAPIRHLFLLVSNILIGTRMFEHSSLKKNVAFESCTRLKKMIKQHKKVNEVGGAYLYSKPFSYEACSPYENSVGLNIPSSSRSNFQIFKLIDSFGIGERTTNSINNFLIYSQEYPENHALYNLYEEFKKYCEADHHFGIVSTKELAEDSLNPFLQYKVFDNESSVPVIDGTEMYNVKSEFLDPIDDDANTDLEMHQEMCQQRRRLFFSVPDNHLNAIWRSVWDLSHFPDAMKYKKYYQELKANQRGRLSTESNELEQDLVKGLNRVFTGMYTKTNDKIFIPTLRGLGRNNVQKYAAGSYSSIRWRESVVVKKNGKYHEISSEIYASQQTRIPEFVIRYVANNESRSYSFTLTLELCQFLINVSNGVYPIISSNNLFEDLRDYQTNVAQIFEQFKHSTDEIDEDEFFVIENNQGNLQIEKRTYKF